MKRYFLSFENRQDMLSSICEAYLAAKKDIAIPCTALDVSLADLIKIANEDVQLFIPALESLIKGIRYDILRSETPEKAEEKEKEAREIVKSMATGKMFLHLAYGEHIENACEIYILDHINVKKVCGLAFEN